MTATNTATHKHKFVLGPYSIEELGFYCSCGKRISRKPTEDEIAFIEDQHRQFILPYCKFPTKPGHIHYVYHRLLNRILKTDGTFKFNGYKLMCQLEKFARDYPTCKIVGCDDNYSCCSDMLLIPHESDTQYWGTSVVIAPQNGKASTIFLYPGHLKDFLAALNVLNQKYRKKEPLRRKADKEWKQKMKAAGFSLKVKNCKRIKK